MLSGDGPGDFLGLVELGRPHNEWKVDGLGHGESNSCREEERELDTLHIVF